MGSRLSGASGRLGFAPVTGSRNAKCVSPGFVDTSYSPYRMRGSVYSLATNANWDYARQP
jgi:hypothetical protein